MRVRHLAATGLLALAIGTQACAGDDFETGAGGGGQAVEPNCPEDLFSCGPGLTCWIGGEPGATFLDCYNEGSAAVGETCAPAIAAPPCQKNLFCAQLTGQTQGSCTPYCEQQNPDRGCTDGRTCQSVTIDVVTVQICI